MKNLNDGIEIAIADLMKEAHPHREPLDYVKIDKINCLMSVRFSNIEDFIVDRIEAFAYEHQAEDNAGRKGVCLGNSPYINTDSRVIQALENIGNFSLISSEKYRGLNLKGNFPKEAFYFGQNLSESVIRVSQLDRIRPLETISSVIGTRQGRDSKKEIPTFSITHSKFLVLGVVLQDGRFDPSEVITGSFNFSANATYSLENIIWINDVRVATAFTRQWYNLLLIALCQRRGMRHAVEIASDAMDRIKKREEDLVEEIMENERRRLTHELLMDALEHENELSANIPEEDR